jgi:uncharacterized phage-associated protein
MYKTKNNTDMTMTSERQRKKLINAIIYFAQNTEFCHKLKLMKLLYYLDFWHFKETGKSVTGLNYKAWKMGPVPPQLYHEIEPENNPSDIQESLSIENEEFENGNGRFLKIVPRKEFNEKIFSQRELEILEKVALVFKDAKANEMSDCTHLKNSPWYKTKKEKGESAWIDYLLALDDEDNSLSPDEVKERLELDKETRELLKRL